MDQGRRQVMRAGSAGILGALLAAGFLKPGDALAAEWRKSAFEAKTLAEALKALGVTEQGDGKAITMTAPDIAENGAAVQISATSTIPKTESIAILVDKNPNPLSALFLLPEGTEPYVATRVKMGQTSNVTVLVRADGKFHATTKEVKVTLGGCGG